MDDMKCAHCGGLIAIRNPRGDCDHLYWPDNLTDEAKFANGFVPVTTTIWVKDGTGMSKRSNMKF